MIWFDTEIVQMIKVSVKNVLVIHKENFFFFFFPVQHDKNLPLIQKHSLPTVYKVQHKMYISLQTTSPPTTASVVRQKK